MKKILIFITLMLISIGISITPVYAEEVIEDETTEDIYEEVVYTFTDGETSGSLTLISETECILVATQAGMTATVNGTYVIIDNILELYLQDELFETFILNEDGTLDIYEIDEPSDDTIEDVPEDEFISSDIGSYFEKEIAPLLLEVGVTLLGFIVAGLIMMIKNKSFTMAFAKTTNDNLSSNTSAVQGAINDTSEDIKKALEASSNANNINNQKIAEMISVFVDKSSGEIKKNISGNTEAYNTLVQVVTSLKDSVEQENKMLKSEVEKLKAEKEKLYADNQRATSIAEDLRKLKESFKVIVCNDPKLVANGQAKYVAKELDTNGETKQI